MAIRSARSAPTSTGACSSNLGSAGVPETFIVDGRGIIRHQHIGAITTDDMPAIIAAFQEAGAMRRALLALLIFAATPALADSLMPPARWANVQLPDPAKERQARALMDTIRCLVCQGESIADSPAEMAGDMRSLIRERIQAGESAESIRAWLISRYGDQISLQPPFSWANLSLYLLPLILLGGGLFLVRGRFRRRKRS